MDWDSSLSSLSLLASNTPSDSDVGGREASELDPCRLPVRRDLILLAITTLSSLSWGI